MAWMSHYLWELWRLSKKGVKNIRLLLHKRENIFFMRLKSILNEGKNQQMR